MLEYYFTIMWALLGFVIFFLTMSFYFPSSPFLTAWALIYRPCDYLILLLLVLLFPSFILYLPRKSYLLVFCVHVLYIILALYGPRLSSPCLMDTFTAFLLGYDPDVIYLYVLPSTW